MDHLKKLTELVSKYRWAVLILLLGVVLMLIPSGQDRQSEPAATEATEPAEDLEGRLANLLTRIQGVGKAEVLLTVQTGKTTVYRIDEDGTVIVTDENRTQNGLVERVEAAQYRGAVVVCQGADSPTVKLNVVEAVASVTGLSADRITVLKMK